MRHGESEGLKYFILREIHQSADLQYLLDIVNKVENKPLKKTIMQRAIVIKDYELAAKLVKECKVSIGQLLEILKYTECAFITYLYDHIPELFDGLAKKDLFNWPEYKKYIMERFCRLRRLYSPGTSFLVDEWLF